MHFVFFDINNTETAYDKHRPFIIEQMLYYIRLAQY